jgi:L-ribulose-5-phosphate 4-epimerase
VSTVPAPRAGLDIEVVEANKLLVSHGLVMLSWGNVSAVDREAGVVAIKPSGVDYAELCAETIAIVALADGTHLSGLQPSSDTPTHVELYRRFPAIGGIAHTHSPWATVWAQACRALPCLGTTHADHFAGEVPCTGELDEAQIRGRYEHEIGVAIAEALASDDPLEVPAVLVARHGPFTWGRTAAEAVVNALVLETAACYAYRTLALDPGRDAVPTALLERHYRRKHGPEAYYGQAPKGPRRA